MSMVTRCAACGTTFRITMGQLQAQSGKVRCGGCSTVFNAFDTLASVPDSAIRPATAGFADEPVAPASATGDWLSEIEPAPEAARGGRAPAGESPPGMAAELVAEEPAPASRVPPAAAPAPSAAEVFPAAAAYADDLLAPRRRTSWGAVAGAALLAAALAGQLAYLFRTQVSVLAPGTRPALEAACEVLGCSVPLPRNADLMVIEASDLRAEEAPEGRLTLSFVLRNRAPHPQDFPAVELTLTDRQGQPAVRRVLQPADYLEHVQGRADPARGISAGADLPVQIAFDTGELRPAGYRLYTFYP